MRFCPGLDGKTLSHVELRCCDATMQVHLALSALVKAGLLGIQQHARLPQPATVRTPGLLQGSLLMS